MGVALTPAGIRIIILSYYNSFLDKYSQSGCKLLQVPGANLSARYLQS